MSVKRGGRKAGFLKVEVEVKILLVLSLMCYFLYSRHFNKLIRFTVNFCYFCLLHKLYYGKKF